jgi:hypothetical protein
MLIRKTAYWQLIERLISLKDSKVIDESMSEFLPDITALNKQQLEKGEYVSGVNLPDYSEISVEIFGKPDGAMTLNHTGDYYESFKAILTDTEILLESNPIKTDKGVTTNIEKKYGADYGEDIKGLNESNFTIIKESIEEEAINQIRRILFGGSRS